MTMLIKNLQHVAIIVQDLRVMINYYSVLLDAVKIKDIVLDSEPFRKGIGVPNAKARTVHLYNKDINLTIELTQFISPILEENKVFLHTVNRIGYGHLSFEVSDIIEVYKHLEMNRCEVNKVSTEISTIIGDDKRICFAYIRDPEGNIIELINYKEL
ncbi:VOC family protein [Salmonella enterica]